jgi:acyl carrier protein
MADSSANLNGRRISGVVQTLLARRGIHAPVGDRQDLKEAGLTSLDLVNLMLAVEAEFDIEISEAEMTPDNFRTIHRIEALVATLASVA